MSLGKSLSWRPLREWLPEVFGDCPPQKALFRVDAGKIPGLSFGHLSRCLTLGRVMAELFGTESLLVMRDIQEGILHAQQAGWPVRIIDSGCSAVRELAFLCETIDGFQPDWFFLDLPYIDIDFSILSYLRSREIKTFFIDDARFLWPDADIVLNSSILATKKRRPTHERQHTRCLVGPRFFVFDERQGSAIPIKTLGKKNVLVSFGGSDPTGLTEKVLLSLASENWHDIIFRVILGPGFGAAKGITEIVFGRGEFEIYNNPESPLPFERGCDLAICAGGQTLYELLCLNKVILPVASAEHEARVVLEFIRQGYVPFGLTEWHSDDFVVYLKNSLRSFCVS